jgi:hypothetical protein
MQGYGGNPGPIYPRNDFVADMTAIALVHTQEGLVIAADGRSRWGDDATRDAAAIRNESEHEKKIFKAELGSFDVAWTLTGTIFNKDRTFNLVTIAKSAFHSANTEHPGNLDGWLRLYQNRVCSSISDAKTKGIIGPFVERCEMPIGSEERLTIARIMIAGYFFNGSPGFVMIRLHHVGGILSDIPQLTVMTNQNITMGSDEIRKRYLSDHEDRRFKHYFRPDGPTLAEGLAHAKGYIEACRDPLAAELDPLCKGIGGHIHAAAVTQSGFTWLIKPIPKPK